MTPPVRPTIPAVLALLAALALAGCATPAALQPTPAPSVFVLEATPAGVPTAPPGDLTLVVSTPRAEPGFDTRRIAYTRSPLTLDYYTKSAWADAPARMLHPLMVQALDGTGAFKAVLAAPSPISGDLRLDLDIVRLQHEFIGRPSEVRLTLRAKLYEVATRNVLATKVFETVEPAPSEDAYGGVQAANRAVARLLGEVAAFVVTRLP